MKELVAINGTICAPQDAKISVFDRGFLFGDGIYEVTRSYGKILFFLEDHIQRLYRSAEQIHMTLPWSQTELRNEIYRVHRAAGGENAYMRIQISRGEGPIGLDPRNSRGINCVIFLKPLPMHDPKCYTEGVVIVTTEVLRNAKGALDPNIKSGNYLNNILAIQKGLEVNAAECLMVDAAGFITEGTTSNVAMVKGGRVITSPDNSDILHGITRRHVRDLAKKNGIAWDERGFTPEELRQADEVFLLSSTREVMAVRAVDRAEIRQTPGPTTQRLLQLYREHISGYLKWAEGTHPWKV